MIPMKLLRHYGEGMPRALTDRIYEYLRGFMVPCESNKDRIQIVEALSLLTDFADHLPAEIVREYFASQHQNL